MMLMCTRRTLRTVLVTSLFWLVIQAIFLFSNICFNRTSSGSQEEGESVIHLDSGQRDKSPNGPVKARLSMKTLPPKYANVTFPLYLSRSAKGELLYHHDDVVYPIPEGLGENGGQVAVPSDLKTLSDKMFVEHQFNLLASQVMSVNRTLPDFRDSRCNSEDFPRDLPNTSIVIVFHNEAWTTLLRTLHSVINRSPHHLLKEIILVDDASEKKHLGLALEAYIFQLPIPTQVIRMGNRSGLIQSRLRGAAAATGATITFLDAHIEASEGWLPPLLAAIYRNRLVVAVPLIDVISDKDFNYRPVTEGEFGGFSWDLVFHWMKVSDKEAKRRGGDPRTPIRSPTMAGGLFTIDRRLFYEMGAYDGGMVIWGGENIEMSFRLWMCGAEIHMFPCSHVGHVFRKASPYTWPGGVSYILHHNSMRTAVVWMDDYQRFYTGMKPEAKKMDYGDVHERVVFRKKNCPHSFKWYLQNIVADIHMPQSVNSLGRIRNNATNLCLDTMSRKEDEKAGVFACHESGNSQFWAHTSEGNIQNNRVCLEIRLMDRSALYMAKCRPRVVSQFFVFSSDKSTLFNRKHSLCLGVLKGQLHMGTCTGSPFQKWDVSRISDLS